MGRTTTTTTPPPDGRERTKITTSRRKNKIREPVEMTSRKNMKKKKKKKKVEQNEKSGYENGTRHRPSHKLPNTTLYIASIYIYTLYTLHYTHGVIVYRPSSAHLGRALEYIRYDILNNESLSSLPHRIAVPYLAASRPILPASSERLLGKIIKTQRARSREFLR